MSDVDLLRRHRAAWEARPELRTVYREWFAALLEAVGPGRPVVEVGAGPGFFKDFAPALIATDVVPGLAVGAGLIVAGGLLLLAVRRRRRSTA